MWQIEGTDEFAEWFDTLDGDTQEDIAGALDLLADEGPQLGRPLVDTLVASRHANMKELRPSPSLRILFAFDPRRMAILLCSVATSVASGSAGTPSTSPSPTHSTTSISKH